MITVISGTNRPESRTRLVARYCYDYLVKVYPSVKWLDLVDYQDQVVSSTMYDAATQNQTIAQVQTEIIAPATSFLIISPEYNGSFPGILKSFIDTISVKDHIGTFGGKKAALIGTSTGRAGNLRGMEHFTGILNYLNVVVMPNKLPISSIQKFLNEGNIDPNLTQVLDQFLNEYLDFIQK